MSPRNRRLLVVCALLLGAPLLGAAAEPGASAAGAPTKVFVLVGDESMLGRAQPVGSGESPDPRLLLWRNGAWIEASDPLGDPADRRNGVGLGMSFGLRVLAGDPSATVGLVLCARAETTMRDWASAKRVKSCVQAVRDAGGAVAGLLFLEGRGDAKNRKLAEDWESRFATMLASFRAQLGVDFPYLVGQLGNVQKASYASLVRDQQALAATTPGVFLVPSLDLPVGPDGVTFTVDAYQTLGARFADAWRAGSATWHSPDEVFVLAGQSNMVGRGKPSSAGTQNTNPDILIQRNGVWQVASDPLGDPSNRESGVGPGMTFALSVLQHRPEETIGLIMCAVGGTDMTEWLPSGDLYPRCIADAQEAGEPVGGILYLQGESDANDPDQAATWKDKFERMLAAFRRDLGPSVPFALGQIGHIEDHGGYYPWAPQVREAQAEAAAENGLPLVVTEDLPLQDDVHFTVDAYKTIGYRFGDAWWSLAGR